MKHRRDLDQGIDLPPDADKLTERSSNVESAAQILRRLKGSVSRWLGPLFGKLTMLYFHKNLLGLSACAHFFKHLFGERSISDLIDGNRFRDCAGLLV